MGKRTATIKTQEAECLVPVSEEVKHGIADGDKERRLRFIELLVGGIIVEARQYTQLSTEFNELTNIAKCLLDYQKLYGENSRAIPKYNHRCKVITHIGRQTFRTDYGDHFRRAYKQAVEDLWDEMPNEVEEGEVKWKVPEHLVDAMKVLKEEDARISKEALDILIDDLKLIKEKVAYLESFASAYNNTNNALNFVKPKQPGSVKPDGTHRPNIWCKSGE